MNIGTIAGATRTIGESQGYLGLPLRDELVHCEVNGPGVPSMASAWYPTEDELARLAAGEPIILRVLGERHPPVLLSVGDELCN